MVYFSNREMKILRLMTQNYEGVSIDELMHSLDVSKRTVYRELSSLQDTIKNIDLTLEKEGKLHRLRGSESAFKGLLKELELPLSIEWLDVEKRQIALLGMLVLQGEKATTTNILADRFNVSLTTVQQDINRLNEVLAKYNIIIERNENQTLDRKSVV